jgi:hypothetical protein
MAGDLLQFGMDSGSAALGNPTITPDPTKDYIYVGPGRMTPQIPHYLPQEIDDVTRNFGFKTFEAMLTDPTVYSQYLALKLAMVTGPVRVMAAIRPKGMKGRRLSVPREGEQGQPGEKRALEIAEFCKRDIVRPKAQSFKNLLIQMLDMMAFGNRLAEKTRAEVEAGPDKGKLGLKSIKVKPYWAWKFVVDGTMEPQGILTYVPPQSLATGDPSPNLQAVGGYVVIP